MCGIHEGSYVNCPLLLPEFKKKKALYFDNISFHTHTSDIGQTG